MLVDEAQDLVGARADLIVTADSITGPVKFDTKGDRSSPEYLAVRATGNPPQFAPFAIRKNGTWGPSS